MRAAARPRASDNGGIRPCHRVSRVSRVSRESIGGSDVIILANSLVISYDLCGECTLKG